MKDILKLLRKLLVWAIIAFFIALLIFYFAQDFVTFPGRGLYTRNPSEWTRRVAALGSQGCIPAEFAGPGGTTVHGIWAPAAPASGPAILWLHGRQQTTTEINQDIKPLTQAGLHVFAMEYRGYGQSTGDTTEANLLADAETSIEWMGKHESVAGKRIFVGGLELGANLAIKVAARNQVQGVIAVNPIPDLATAVSARIPFVPLGFLLREKFDLAPDLGAVAVPVLLIHGGADGVVPLAKAEEMVSRLGGPAPARLREVPGGGQLDTLERGGRDLIDDIERFKDRPR